ncbi:hypothetical protein Hypma_012911 [Hypsizygus marmoreus]|uniref:Uncharacterized protein n=1 Tax=Hypsizygus marmoreus TaxID=39966 RepID=A0A369JL25_HYPMA|nr:hypothetical protein Hypma_012911 [Hypsizygus marmoreus]
MATTPATIPFPKMSRTHRTSISGVSDMSVMSVRATSLDVCEYVYGDSKASIDVIARFYEPNAIIADIQKVSRQLSSIDVPRPLAMFCTLFRLKLPQSLQNADPLFQGLRVWTEIGDICENESFDGHRKTIVEHTLNILLLPGIHCHGHRTQGSVDSLVSTTGSPSLQPQHPHPPSSLRIPGTAIAIPSPFHFKLHVVTRLSFNEQGQVTHHRDFWDVKDVIGLVPGVPLAQWVGTRLAAKGLSYMARACMHGRQDCGDQLVSTTDIERGMTPPAAYVACTKNALGLDGIGMAPQR